MAYQYRNQTKTGAQKGLEMKMSGQAKGACFNKAVDAAIAVYDKTSTTPNANEAIGEIVNLTEAFFEAFKPINMEDVATVKAVSDELPTVQIEKEPF